MISGRYTQPNFMTPKFLGSPLQGKRKSKLNSSSAFKPLSSWGKPSEAAMRGNITRNIYCIKVTALEN